MTELQAIFRRIEDRALFPLGEDVRQAIVHCPDPMRAAVHLERWLQASSGPTMFLSLLNEGGPTVKWLMGLLAASHQIADVLAQNPELGAIFFEPWDPPDLGELLFEGRRLLEVATSPSHELDRLRLMKQRWTLRIAYVDVNRLWSTPSVLEALSVLADALIQLTLESTWRHFALERGLTPTCPLRVIAFGKLGGGEINYSSDIDLAYLIDDDADEATEKALSRFCPIFARALEDQMGRGMLYRVDLRLRPYGKSGPILNRFKAVEAYYDRYAETWEHLALIRSRMICGAESERWDSLRERIAFLLPRGAWQIEELLTQRARLEEIQIGNDLKRGPGGIRDIEFLTQILQLVYARTIPTLRIRNTIDTLGALSDVQLLSEAEAEQLAKSYQLFRTIEHWLQLEGNRQTHQIPEPGEDLDRLARLLGHQHGVELSQVLNEHRTFVRDRYESALMPLLDPSPERLIERRLGTQAEEVSNFFDRVPSGAAYFEAALASEGGLERVAHCLKRAPILAEGLAESPAILEQVISNEIVEADSSAEPPGLDHDLLAFVKSERLKAGLRWSFNPRRQLGASLDSVTDAVLKRLLGGTPLECVALGSYATHDSSWGSDADIVLLSPPGIRHLDAETCAQEFLREVQSLRSAGIAFDLRLRPDGKSGMLARTYDGFRQYASADMDPWERLALGRSRLVLGQRQALELIHQGTDHFPFKSETLSDLLRVKHRLESELMNPAAFARNLKHGHGGFDDLGWMIQLLTLSRPELRSLTSVTTANRLRDLARGDLLNTLEVDALITAHACLVTTRCWIEFLGFEKDQLPENPAKLEKLAEAMELGSGNEALAVVASARDVIRQIYLEQVGRLQRNFGELD